MAKKKEKKSNADVIKEVTEALIEQIEAGTPPWIKPWSSTPFQMPENGATGRQYNGINVFILWATAELKGYGDHRWMTFKQAKDKGGTVRKGEKSTKVIFWRFCERKDKDTGEDVKIPFARTYSVFNVNQIDGLDMEPLAVKTYEHDDVAPASLAMALGDLAKVSYLEDGEKAAYNWRDDVVRIPKLQRFESPSHYAATLAHEMVHWTGHKSRCDRQFGKRFGDDAYAFEELVAEMGAAFVCSALGIHGQLRHAEYLGHWARIARADTYALTSAAKQAEKAMRHLFEAAGGVEAVTARAAELESHVAREHKTHVGYTKPGASTGYEGPDQPAQQSFSF